MEDRSREFERLKLLQMKDSKENTALKMRLQEMKLANDAEKKMLEQQVSKLIHSQAGYIANQKDKINQLQTALQDELTISQNRIAEQEQEIKWLKKALDETNNYASKDQIDKMQHVIDVWQNQAKTAHQELTVVLGQAEELKALNSALINKINELEAAKKQLTDEINESSMECAEVTNKLYEIMREKDEAQDLHKSLNKAYEEAKGLLRERMQSIEHQEAVLQENSNLINSLQADLKISKEKSTQDQALQKSLVARIQDLEKEKSDLANKLTVVVEKIEKKSQQMIEDAQEKIDDKDQVIDDLEKQYLKAKNDYDNLLLTFEELRDTSNLTISQKDQLIEELQDALKKEAQATSKHSARILAAEGEIEGLKDKIVRMQTRAKEKSDAFSKEMDDKNSEIFRLEVDLQSTQAAKDQEKATLMSEFEKIISEKLESHNNEIQEMKRLHEQAMSTMEFSKQAALEGMENEMREREQQHREKILQVEAGMREIFNEEISSCVQELDSQHKSAIAILELKHQRDLENALQALELELSSQKKHELIASKESLTAELSSLFDLKYEAGLREQKDQLEMMFKTTLQANLDDVRSHYGRDIQNLEDAHILTLKQKEEFYQGELANTKVHFEEVISKLKANHQEELSSRLNSASQELTQLLANHKLEIDRLNSSASEVLQSNINELSQRLEKEKLTALDDQEKRSLLHLQEALRDQATALQVEFDDQSRKSLMKQKQELEKAYANILQEKEQEWEIEKSEIIKRLSATNKQHAAMNDEKIVELEKEFEQRLIRKDEQFGKRIEVLQLEFKQTLEESIAREIQIAVMKERESLTSKLSDEFERSKMIAIEKALSTQRSELIAHHEEELQASRTFLLEESGKNIKELEKTFSALLTEKENLIAELNQQIKQMSSFHRDELNSALFEQQKEMMEKSRSELEKFRGEISERESQHQEEITALIATHSLEMSKQRTQLEEAHDLSLNNMKEEVRSLREKLRQTLDDHSMHLSQESLFRIEQKSKYDELLQLKLDEKQKEFEEEMVATTTKYTNEISKLKGQIERLKVSSEEEGRAREEDYRNDIAKLKSSLKDRYQKDLDDLRSRHNEELEHVRLGFGRSREDEISRLHDDYRAQLSSKVSQLADLETKLNEATQSILDSTAKYSKEKVDMLEQYKLQREAQDEVHQKEISLLKVQMSELENSLKSNHKLQMQAMQEQLRLEYGQETEDLLSENRRKEEARQRDLNDLKSQLEKALKARDQIEIDLGKQNEALVGQLTELKERFSSTKQSYRDEVDQIKKQCDDMWLGKLEEMRSEHSKNTTALVEKYQGKIRSLEEELIQVRNKHEETFENLKKQQEDIAKSQRKQQFEMESLQTALVHEQESKERIVQDFAREKSEMLGRHNRELKELESLKQSEIDEIVKSDDFKLQRNVVDLREKHNQAIQELKYQFDLERHQWEMSVEEQRRDAAKVLRERENAFKLKIEELQASFLEDKEDLKTSYDLRLAALESKMETEKTSLVSKAAEDIEIMCRKKEIEFQDLQTHHRDEIEKLKKNMMNEIVNLKDRLSQIADEAENKLSQMEKQYQTSLLAKEAELSAKNEAIKRLEANNQEKIEEILVKHAENVKHLKQDMENMKDSDNIALQELQQHLNRERAARESADQQLVLMEKELEKYKQEVESTRANAINDNEAIIAELKNQQLKTIEMLKKNESLHIQELANNYELESKSYQQRIENFEHRSKDQERKYLEKCLALDDALVNCDGLKAEIDRLSDKLTKMQGDTQDRIQRAMEDKFQDEREAIQNEFQQQLSAVRSQLVAAQKDLKAMELENDKLENQLKDVLFKLEDSQGLELQRREEHQKDIISRQEAFERALQDALEKQRKELQEDHQNSIRNQMDLIVQMIQTQASGKSTESQLQGNTISVSFTQKFHICYNRRNAKEIYGFGSGFA